MQGKEGDFNIRRKRLVNRSKATSFPLLTLMITWKQKNITGKDGLKIKRPGRKLLGLENGNNNSIFKKPGHLR